MNIVRSVIVDRLLLLVSKRFVKHRQVKISDKKER